MMLIVVLKVEDLLEVFVVLLGHILDISDQVLILQVHTPIELVIIFFLYKTWLLILLLDLA